MWSAITVEIQDLTVRVEPDSGVTPINLYAVANAILNNVTASTNVSPDAIVAPTNAQSQGIILPATGNFGWVKAHKIYVIGFYYGVQHSEHADIEGLIQSCVSALYIPDSYSHLAKYRITTQACSHSIYVTAQYSPAFGYCNSICGDLDIERDPLLPFVSDVHLSSGALLNGILNYNVAASPTSGVSTTGTGVNNCVFINIPEAQYEYPTKAINVGGNYSALPEAKETIYFPTALTADSTITVLDAINSGQKVRIYSYFSHKVTVSTGATPMYFNDDNTASYSFVFLSGSGSSEFIEMVWNGNSWVCWTQINVPLPYTVSTLPTPPFEGMRKYVTDASSPTFLGTVTGGGSVVCPVFYNGSAWVAG